MKAYARVLTAIDVYSGRRPLDSGIEGLTRIDNRQPCRVASSTQHVRNLRAPRITQQQTRI